MLMVVIGAGASHDSSPDRPSAGAHRPPLANDLFQDVELRSRARGEYPEIHALIPELLRKTGRTLEESLQKLQGEAATNPRRHQQLLAIRYYLQMLFSELCPHWLRETGVTNYQALLGQIYHYRKNFPGPICIVTFNYDTLIESALLSEFGTTFSVLDDYIAGDEFKLFKLHGSHNWGRHLTGPIPNPLISAPPFNPWGNPHEMIKHAVELQNLISGNFSVVGGAFSPNPVPLYPAIAIPVLNKAQFECPSSHIGALSEIIPKVTKVLAIGWRGGEQHFLNLLRCLPLSGIQIVTVAKDEAEAESTLEQFRKLSIAITKVGCFSGFSESLAERRFDPLLSTA